MKNALLISSILLASAGCAAETQDLQQLQAEALSAREDLVDMVFVSKDTFNYTAHDYDHEAGRPVLRDLQVKLRLKFIRASSYTLDDQETGLDYEVIVEKFVEATGETFGTDMTYFARKLGRVKHEFFDCDSTRRCSTDADRSRMYIFDTPNGKGLRLRNEGAEIITTDARELEFHSQ